MLPEQKKENELILNQYVSGKCQVVGCNYTNNTLGILRTSTLLKHLKNKHGIQIPIKDVSLTKCPLGCKEKKRKGGEQIDKRKRERDTFRKHLKNYENDLSHQEMIKEQKKTQTQLLRDFLAKQGLQLKEKR